MYEKECKWCKELIIVEKQVLFASHVSSCKLNPNFGKKENVYKGKFKVERFEVIKKCKKCNNEFKQNLTASEINNKKTNKMCCSSSCAHSHIMTDVIKEKIRNSINNSESYKLSTINRIKKVKPKIIHKFICKHCNIESIGRKTQHYHKICWLKCCGGIKHGSSRGKCGWYKDYWCDSSYELVWIIYNIDHNIKFKRNRVGFEYTFENKIKKFYPDFILDDGTYIEIKNYVSDITDAKIKAFPYNIKVLYKVDILKYIDYVTNKYGKNYIKLYDNYKEKKYEK